MPTTLLLLALLQAEDPAALLARLGDDDPAARDRATQELSKRGVEIVPPLLELHRTTGSLEARSRAERLLLSRAFAAFARTRPDEALRGALKAKLLKDLGSHLPACFAAPEGSAPRRILRQTGSGHGQFLAVDEFLPRDDGTVSIRRVAFQGTTPYRPHVKEEGVRAEEALLEKGEATALFELLGAATGLHPRCAIPLPEGREWSSTASFSLRFRIESAGSTPWVGAYTGYPGSHGEPDYAHGRLLDDLLYEALVGRAWTPSALVAADRARALRWISEAHAEEEWWVKEHYLDFARHLGDADWLPYLAEAERGLEDKDGASTKRQREAIQDARKRIAERARR
jgi:hypothetical protein